MKRLSVLVCILISTGLSAQILGKHHIEVGTGLAVPKELLFANQLNEASTVNFYGEYRYDITSAFSVGAMYNFVLPHEGAGETLTVMTGSHTLNALVEYKLGPYGPMSLFLGLGAGAQMRSVTTDVQSSLEPYYWSTDLLVRAGLEFFNHLRVSVGHCHDLYYPLSFLSHGAPFYYINLGWSF